MNTKTLFLRTLLISSAMATSLGAHATPAASEKAKADRERAISSGLLGVLKASRGLDRVLAASGLPTALLTTLRETRGPETADLQGLATRRAEVPREVQTIEVELRPIRAGAWSPAGMLPERRESAPDAPAVTGALSPEEVERVIRANMAPVRVCYAQALIKEPHLRVKMSVGFRIDRDGRVETAELEGHSKSGTQVEACVVEWVRGLRFDAPRGGGSVIVHYPFEFSSI